jgi:hypothetical protein
MTLAVHHSSELVKYALAIIGVAVFVVVALTWVPEMIAPSGENAQEAPSVGQTVRMVK